MTTPTLGAPGTGGTTPARYAWLALAICMVAAIVYGTASTPWPAVTSFAVAGLTCLSATVVGIVRHRPTAARSWWAIAGACLAFLIGAALRVPRGHDRLSDLIPDVFTVTGYGLFITAVLGWLRSRRGRADWSSLVDALLVGLAACLVAWALFIVPALSLPNLSALNRAVIASYPVFDVVLLAMLTKMVFSQAQHNTSFTLFMLAMGGFFLGDVAYVALDSGVSTIGRPVVDLPFFFSFGMVAAAALHPSMSLLADHSQRARSGRWTSSRVATIGLALLAVGAMPLLVPARPGTDTVVRLVLTVTVVVATVGRTTHAINRFAYSEAAAQHRASHDSLTGLPNRQGLTDHLAGPCARRLEPVSVLFLDLDGFKLVNDSYGRKVGDQLLSVVAQRLKSVVRPGDFVARLGGDEFVVVIRADAEAAARAASRIIDSFGQPFALESGEVFLTASIGITTVPAPISALSVADLVRDADIAMYVAKTRGRNQVAVFDTSLRDKVQQRVGTETALRYAVAREQLELHYQPLTRLSDNAIVGYEALLRWNHPERGQVSPVEFIPVAEETGLIVPIGEWVIREATRQVAAWRAAGRDLRVSVNVSARQLRDRALVSTIADALAGAALAPESLWVELTETALMEDPEAALASLTELRALGVTLAIDDFGTRYSSLAYLKKFPVSVVKIDREFIRGVGGANEDDEIVRSVAAIAAALGLTLVAEGVERPEQATALARLGCHIGQAWLFGRPRPAASVAWEPQWFPNSLPQTVIRSGDRVITARPASTA